MTENASPETGTTQTAALTAVLDQDNESARALLEGLDIMALQDLAFACGILAALCRDTALNSVWPDDGGFSRKPARLGAQGAQGKD